MKLRLSDILDNLLVGEFSQTGWAQDGEFSIANTNKIIVLLNAAMADISSRFWVKRKEVVLNMCKGQTLYVIDKSVATPNLSLERGATKATTSTKEVFEDDLLEIYEIYDSNGRELPIRLDAGELHGVQRTCGCGCGKPLTRGEFNKLPECAKQQRYTNTLDTPGTITTRSPFGCNSGLPPLNEMAVQLAAYNAIRVPDALPVQKLRVIYRAEAKRLKKVEDNGLYDPTKIFLDLPMTYLQAILYYIASRKFGANQKAVQQGLNEGTNYYQRYIAACTLLQDQGAGVQPTGNSGNKFENNGFV